MTLAELIQTHRLSFTGSIDVSGNYYVSLEYVEIMDNGMLIGATGHGMTLNYAADELCTRIRGQRLVKNAYRDYRYEFDVPETLEYTE